MKISARNQLAGQVGKIATGSVNTEVTIKLARGGEVVAVITKASARQLGLKKGTPVLAVIKASDILVAVP